jgi:hypothetical protein
MLEIVRKLESHTAPVGVGGVPASLQEQQDRTLLVRVHAEALEKMKKQAVVRLESPVGSTWQITCDEGAYLGGDDEAPPPLVYFSAAIAF